MVLLPIIVAPAARQRLVHVLVPVPVPVRQRQQVLLPRVVLLVTAAPVGLIMVVLPAQQANAALRQDGAELGRIIARHRIANLDTALPVMLSMLPIHSFKHMKKSLMLIFLGNW